GTGIGDDLLEGQFRRIVKLAHQGKAPGRGQSNLAGARLAHFERVATAMVDLELGMGMLDDRDGMATPRKLADQRHHQRGLARILPADYAEQRRGHRGCSCNKVPASSSSSGRLMLKKGS